MPDKYIIPSATYNGDGTTSAEATSNGGVGAWNSMSLLTGTLPSDLPGGAGTIAAGDTVYIRSKTAGGSDVTVTVTGSTNLGSASGTDASPVTWIVDHGAIWTSISGTVKFEANCGSNTNAFAVRGGNVFIGKNKNLKFHQAATASYIGAILNFSSSAGAARIVDADISNTAGTNITYSPALFWARETQNVIFENCSFSARRCAHAAQYDDYNNGYGLTLIGCEWDLTSDYTQTYVFNTQQQGSGWIEMIGGKFGGAGLTPGKTIFNAISRGLSVVMEGTVFPRTVPIASRTTEVRSARMSASGADAIAGIVGVTAGGEYDSRDDGFYPYLNGTLPDANPISLCVRAQRASLCNVLVLPTLSKFYGQSTATRTITVEALVNTTRSPTKRDIYATISYIDSTGASRTETTNASGALASSTASWSATSYGPVSFNKYKLELTTAYQIMTGTVVTVAVAWGIRAANSDDVGFIDPDFTIA